MTIKFILIVALMIAFLVIILDIVLKKNLKFRNLQYLFYIISFSVLLFLASITVKNYIYPDEKIFKNTDYHLIQHLGFEFSDSIVYLVNSKHFKEYSIWDDKQGDVKIENKAKNDTLNLTIQHFYEPFYVCKPKESKFKIVNFLFNSQINNGFKLYENDKLILDLKIAPNPDNENKSIYCIKTSDSSNYSVCNFTKNINEAYPIIDIIKKSDFEIEPRLESYLEGTYLVRKEMPIEDNSDDHWFEKMYSIQNSDLSLFPGINFYQNTDLILKSHTDSVIFSLNNFQENYSESNYSLTDSIFNIKIADGYYFYSGVGYSLSDAFYVVKDSLDNFNLKFILPKMFPLKGRDTTVSTKLNLFITSSYNEVVSNNIDAGYYFKQFGNSENKNNIMAKFNYYVGSSTDSMYFSLMDMYNSEQVQQNIAADEEFKLNTKNIFGKTKWLFKFKNLRDNNFLDFNAIMYLLKIIVLLIIFVISFPFIIELIFGKIIKNVVRRKNQKTQSGKTGIDENKVILSIYEIFKVTPFEIILYLIVFVFIFIRILIWWRISTFPPIENITAKIFYGLINVQSQYDLYVFYPVILFFPFILFVKFIKLLLVRFYSKVQDKKNIVTNSSITKVNRNPFKNFKFTGNKLFILHFFVLIISFLLSSSQKLERIGIILIPTLSYFSILLLMSNKKTENVKIWHKIALFFITFLVLYKDAGYAIVFLLYGVIIFIFSIFKYDILFFTNRFKNEKTKLSIQISFSVILLVLFFVLLKYQNDLIVLIFNGTKTFLFITFGFALLFSFIFYLLFKRNNCKRKLLRLGFLSITGFFIVIFLFVGITQNNKILKGDNFIAKINNNQIIQKFKYAKYRSLVQNENLEDIIKDADFEDDDLTFILRSAHNQWFINLFRNGFDSKKDKYFQLQEHSDKGSPYLTQPNDIVVSRYILPEHGKGVVFFVISLLILIIIYYGASKNIFSSTTKFNVFGILILLFSIAFFVFLTSTNRFTFFGQDFPLISVKSLLSTLFALALIVIIIFIEGDYTNDDLVKINENQKTVELNKRKSFLVPLIGVILLITGVFLILKPKTDKNQDYFDFTELMENTNLKINQINASFLAFQKSEYDNLKKLNLNQKLDSFKIKDSVNIYKNCNQFTESILNHFFKNTTNKWDNSEILHIRKKGDFYNLTLNRSYFYIASNKEEEKQWSGDLLAAETKKDYSFITPQKDKYIPKLKDENGTFVDDIIFNIISLDDYNSKKIFTKKKSMVKNLRILKIPESWTPYESPIYIVKQDNIGTYESVNKSYFQILNTQENYCYTSTKSYESKEDTRLAIKLVNNDVLSIYNDNTNDEIIYRFNLVEDDDNYLARNIWLNGSNTYYYPLGNEFLWAYSFSNVLQDIWYDNLNTKDSSLVISIDYDLTSSVYDIIDKENKQSATLYEDLLINFRNLSYANKKNKTNKTGIYFDNFENKLKVLETSDLYDKKKLANDLKYIINEFSQLGGENVTEDEEKNGYLIEAINNYTKREFNYSAVAIDGNGRIRLLFDYNKYQKADPNSEDDYYSFLNSLYKQSTNAVERDFLGNLCLLKLNPGPGSSIKPIFYNSVTSQYNLGWENLKIAAFNSKVIEDKNSKGFDDLAYYGGKKLIDKEGLKRYWNVSDYDYAETYLKGSNYLVGSNNIFESLVIFLGSYNKDQMRNAINGNNEIFITSKSENTSDPYNFPTFSIGSNYYRINSEKWPEFTDYKTLLADALDHNYKYYTNINTSPINSFYTNFISDSINDNYYGLLNVAIEKSKLYIWCLPEFSMFNYADRDGIEYRSSLFQPTLGGFPIEITPLKMAELYVKLVSQNINASVTLNPDYKNKNYKFFTFDDSWKDTTEYLTFLGKYLMKQLKYVSVDGTADYLNDDFLKHREYFIYSKTGTLNIEESQNQTNNPEDERAKHLVVIISQESLHDGLTIEKLKRVKYYVVYMSYHDISKGKYDGNNFAKIIDEIINSELFIEYMKNGK